MAAKITKIYSENNDFQYVDTLRRKREKRHQCQEFFVEGVRPINQALAYNWRINAFLYSRDRRLSDWAEGILAHSQAKTHFEVPYPLLEKLSHKENPSELMALVAMPEERLSRIPIKGDMRIVIVDRPASPGNLGTLIRSCDALRVHGLVITGHAVDLYDPETIRATTGSLFAVPIVRISAPTDLMPWFDLIKRTIGDFQIVGSDEKATQDVAFHDFTLPTILVVGNETWGMSAFYKDLCDVIVRIPIDGSATSLNVACAASIILYEMDKQRRGIAENETI